VDRAVAYAKISVYTQSAVGGNLCLTCRSICMLREVKHSRRWWWTDYQWRQSWKIRTPCRRCSSPGERSKWSFFKPEMNGAVWWYNAAGGAHHWRRSMERRQIMLHVRSHRTYSTMTRNSKRRLLNVGNATTLIQQLSILWFTDVSRIITFPERRFPCGHFPGKCC